MSITSTRIALSLALLALFLLPLHRGGYPDAARALFGALSGAAVLFAAFHKSSLSRDRLYLMSLLLWVCWIGWQVIQLVPMPADWLAWLAPASFEHHDRLQALGLKPDYRIALSRSSAQAGLAWSLFLFALYLAISGSIDRDLHRLRTCLTVLFLWAVLQALYGSFNHLTGFSIPLIDPNARMDKVAHGTFANRNHFAGYLTLGVAFALALLLGGTSRPGPNWSSPLRRLFDIASGSYIWYRLGLLAMVIGVILSQSRMGNVAMAAGITSFAVIWILTTRSLQTFWRACLVFLSIALVDVALISERFGLERVIERIESTDLDQETRIDASQMAWMLAQQFGLAGAGHGSFRHLEHQVRPDPDFGYLGHAHNDFLELVIEFGWIGGGLLIALLTVHLAMAIRALGRRRRIHKATGAALIMTMISAGLHANVEFNFHIPAYSASFVALLAIVAALGPARPATRRAGLPVRRE